MNSIIKDIIALKNANVFIIGDIFLESYIERYEQKKRIPGGASSFAVNIATIGAIPILCGIIGNDNNGRILKEILEQYQIDTSFLISNEQSTCEKKHFICNDKIIMKVDNQLKDKFNKVKISQEKENKVLEHYENFLNNYTENRCLLISDHGKKSISDNLLKSLIELSKKYEVPIVTDPVFSENPHRYNGSTVIKYYLCDGEKYLKSRKSANSFPNEIQSILDCYLENGIYENVILSDCDKGVVCKGKRRLDDNIFKIENNNKGDVLLSFVAMSLACKQSFSRSIEIGNIAYQVVNNNPIEKTVSLFELLDTIRLRNDMQSYSEKILDDELLAFISKRLRLENKTIVFTNGCFDILHIGHVRLLQTARSYGDLLIVAINSDDSIKRLKGADRPILTAHDRATILASLSCVNYVVIYKEDTPIELLLKFKPHILVKGSDYTMETIVGAKEVFEYGGEVKQVTLVSNKSTSLIIKKASSGFVNNQIQN